MTSLADQILAELGGVHSVLARQKRDHVELDRLIHAVDESSGAQRREYLNELCRWVFPHAFAEESVLWPAIRRWVPEGEELTPGDRTRAPGDQRIVSRRSSGQLSSISRQVSQALARIAGSIEHVPLLTRAEDPSTHSGRTARPIQNPTTEH